MSRYLQQCPCGSKLFPDALHDGHGIFMCYVCDKCRSNNIKKYRSDIFERYECDEPIDAD